MKVWVGERVTSRMAEAGFKKRGNLRVGGAMAQWVAEDEVQSGPEGMVFQLWWIKQNRGPGSVSGVVCGVNG